MASYMPSFMSKHISTGAEAAYGQPFAFTTGDKTAAGTTPKSGKERKKNKKKNRAKKGKAARKAKEAAEAAEKKHHKHGSPLKPDDMTAMKQIGKTHTEARYSAFHLSKDITALNVALRAANAAALQSKIDILEQYHPADAQGVENAKMKRMRKDLQYFKSQPKNTDSRVFTVAQFERFSNIYTTFYSAQISAMLPENEHTGADLKANMKDIVDTKKRALTAFYSFNPLLSPKSKQRPPVPESEKAIGG